MGEDPLVDWGLVEILVGGDQGVGGSGGQRASEAQIVSALGDVNTCSALIWIDFVILSLSHDCMPGV